MRLLALETSGPLGGIALAQDGRIIDEVRLTEGLRHVRDLILACKGAYARAGWPARGADVVAVSIGPGSFTGVRIAVTVAKILAWDAGARVVAVPSLLALARNAPPQAARIACILDAKRGGLYAGTFEQTPDGPAATFGPALIEPQALAGRLDGPVLVLGHGIAKARAVLEGVPGLEFAPAALWDIRPAAVTTLGLRLADAGRFEDAMRLEPVYIRPPEAQEIWERRHGGTP
jgi:tRNA threonylcarbamoyladenosine biosynthesis protein TsaB